MVILYAWLLADFFTGLVHWAQDRLLLAPSKYQLLNTIKEDNDLHHSRPAAMVQCTRWDNIKFSAMFAWPLSLMLFFSGCPAIVWLTVFFASFANLVHRYAHVPRGKLNSFLRFMQATGLFISIDHHKVHHFDSKGPIKKEDTTVRYCPMSNWVNPVLDKIKFFHLLEYVLIAKKS